MADCKECICIKVRSKLGENAVKTFKMLKVILGEETLEGAGIEWFSDFCLRCWMLRMSMNKQNRWKCGSDEVILKNGRITIHKVVNMLGILFGLVEIILGGVWMCVRLPPHSCPTCWGAERELCQYMACIREWHERIPEFLSKTIAGHEMMVCVYDSGTEGQSIRSAFKTRQDKFSQMWWACLLVNTHRVVCYELVTREENVNQHYHYLISCSNLMHSLFIIFFFIYYIFSYSSTCFEPYCTHHQEDLLYIHSIWFFICHSS